MTGTRYPPHVLREYALLADGERGALISPCGDLAWMCAPRWDSEGVFTSIMGGDSVYAITPVGRFVWGGQYEEGSLIWWSRWVTDGGIVEVREALAFPGDPDRAVILRRVHAREGPARLDIVLEPAAAFGARQLSEQHRDDHGVWRARVSDALWLRWSGGGDAAVSPDGGRLTTVLDLAEGDSHDLVLEIADTEPDDRPPDPDRAWAATEAAWNDTVPDLSESITRRDARHAYAVLRGLTSSSGGMVAAATMSLPERANEGRNYDYRYVWIRDQCYTGQSVAASGPHPLLDDAVRFVSARLLDDGPRLMPAYTIAGRAVPDERSVGLPGYPGGTDILGNHVNSQFQLDNFGEALLLFAAAARHGRLGLDHHKAIEVAVKAITTRLNDPEAGVWELDDQRWTHSQLTCAAGLRAIAGTDVPATDAAEYSRLADSIVADTGGDCVHPSGRWQRGPGDPRVDAALLLPAIRGAVPAADARSRATLSAVRDELGEDGYVYRFRQGSRPLGDAEGAFVLCGFWMALAEHQQGDTASAVRWFERNRSACGPPGLLSEEYDVRQRQLRGNLPQAFVHALLIESSVRLANPWTGPT